MPAKKVVIIASILVFLLIIVCVIFLSSKLVPKNPSEPYFPEVNQRISAVSWRLGEFQPIYLFSYEKGQGLYFKVIYRNNEGKLTLMDIFLGGKLDNEEYPMVYYYNGKEIVNKDAITFGSFKYPLKLGQRIRIMYLIDAGNWEAEAAFCSQVKLICQYAKLITKDGGNSNLEFYDTSILPKDKVLPALSVHDLVRK